MRTPPPGQELPPYANLTPTEAARYLRIGRSTIYNLIAEGEIPSARYGRIIRIPREALLAYRSGAEILTDSPRKSR